MLPAAKKQGAEKMRKDAMFVMSKWSLIACFFRPKKLHGKATLLVCHPSPAVARKMGISQEKDDGERLA
jgi:hypothetical protein